MHELSMRHRAWQDGWPHVRENEHVGRRYFPVEAHALLCEEWLGMTLDAKEMAFKWLNNAPGSCGIRRENFDHYWADPSWHGHTRGRRLIAEAIHDFPNDPAACMALECAINECEGFLLVRCKETTSLIYKGRAILDLRRDNTPESICTAIRDAGLKALELREASDG